MKLRELGLADVAGLRFAEFARRRRFGGTLNGGCRRDEDGRFAGLPDTRGRARFAIHRLLAHPSHPPQRLDQTLLLERLRPRGATGCDQ